MTCTEQAKPKCRYCGKATGELKGYIIADNMEEPKLYHPKCMDKFRLEMIIRLGELKK